MGLFIKKPLGALQAEANESGSKTLKRVLGPWSLVALGVGVIIGAGLFSITGTVAAGYTGPAITLSFAIAALGCCFAGLCYAEFASMIPVAGSAYTYSYATMGELIAWIIGWDLVPALYRSRNDGQYQLEPVSGRIPRRGGYPSATYVDGMSLGRRDSQYTRFSYCRTDEYFPDTGNGREVRFSTG